mmetsp:Transcript_19865/g.46341  ORF Transcript_19865/g.46341 Transcript_19865/m.46341 type:complete len:421 (+) Transcript_19865:304-1566(+)
MSVRVPATFAFWTTTAVRFLLLISLYQHKCLIHAFHWPCSSPLVRGGRAKLSLIPVRRAMATVKKIPANSYIDSTILYPWSSLSSSSLAANNVYGRGADIWPESNNDAIELSDSFPNGNVPYSAILAIEQDDMESIHQRVQSSTSGIDNRTDSKGSRTKQYIKRILRMAASKEELESEGKLGSIGKLPIAIGLLLLMRGLVRPMDVALVACWTAYFVILNMTAQSSRDGGAPILPAIPPQGHVPSILSNPMGIRFEQSVLYQRWLKLGALFGLVGPLLWLLTTTIVLPWKGAVTLELESARLVGRHVFLLCCQMTTEAISKRSLIPLPLRILIPVAYNASRLIYLWSWATSPAQSTILCRIGQCLAIANAAYWAINLFAYLIPIASMRYMRAHFFGVEAEEVTTRIGLEETVGLVANNSL